MAKTISMHSAVNKIMSYVACMATLLPTDAEVVALQEEQPTKVVALITECKVDAATAYDDGKDALATLQHNGCPWTVSQTSAIAAAIRVQVEVRRLKAGDQQDNDSTAEYLPE